MTVLLWLFQAVLAVVFAAAGALKLAKPKAALVERLPALQPYRPLSIKAIAVAEVLGALGVLVTPFVGLGALVPWAALGLACVMVAGAFAHAEHGDWKGIGLNAAVFAIAVVVMYGRTTLPA